VGVLAGEELRALQAGADVDGGYLVAPQQFVTELIKAVDDQVAIRGLARTFQVPQAASMGAPSLDADPSDADWTTELQTGAEDTAMRFGKRELRPHPLAKRIKVSQQLLRQALIGPEGLVLDRLAYKFAVSQEKAFLTGSGAGRPLGVFTASPNGISTNRDVATGNTTTAIGFDGLIEAKSTLKGQYWPRARWIFHRDAVKQITKLKDGDGQYIWRQSVREGEPDTLLGLPMTISEWAPNTFTTGLYVGLIGDFQHYWIVDALAMQVQRLNELYAETNQVGFIGRLETDGAPVLEEAFVRVKLA
jgi:HK97 family phage major capsid protein